MRQFSDFLKILLTVIVVTGCFPSQTADNGDGGSGSEIVGTVESSGEDTTTKQNMARGYAGPLVSGIPVNQGKIFIFPDDFEADVTKNPADYIPRVFTDSTGFFRIDNVLPGAWVLEASDGRGKAIARRVRVRGDGVPINLGILTVDNTAALKYTIKTDFPDTIPILYHVFVLGTRIHATGNNDNVSMQLEDIPTGISYSIKVRLAEPIRASKTFSNIGFNPGQIEERTFDLTL